MEKCQNCKFWKKNNQIPYTYGMCRFMPPKMIDHTKPFIVLFPETNENDWCGQWKTDRSDY